MPCSKAKYDISYLYIILCRAGALGKNTGKACKLTEVEIADIFVNSMFKFRLELHEHINSVIY